MRHRRKWICLALLATVLVYSATFTYKWRTSPVEKRLVAGREICYVQFHFNAFFWRTQILWSPAFWFVEHVCGYEFVSYIPLEQDSIVEYAK